MESGRAAAIAGPGARGPLVVLDACPYCRRPIRLDFAGSINEHGRPVVDMTSVAMAQRLHLASCAS